MSEANKCPKCDGNMIEGKVRTYAGVFSLKKPGDIAGDRIRAFYCEDCGYIELRKEMPGGRDTVGLKKAIRSAFGELSEDQKREAVELYRKMKKVDRTK